MELLSVVKWYNEWLSARERIQDTSNELEGEIKIQMRKVEMNNNMERVLTKDGKCDTANRRCTGIVKVALQNLSKVLNKQENIFKNKVKSVEKLLNSNPPVLQWMMDNSLPREVKTRQKICVFRKECWKWPVNVCSEDENKHQEKH